MLNECRYRIIYPEKTSLKKEGEIKIFSNEGQTKTIHYQKIFSKRIAKESSSKRRQMIPEGNGEHWE